MNDLAVVQTFVQSFIQGEAVLLSNLNLRMEPAFDTIQLLAKLEGLIATAKLTNKPRSVLVKQKSSYWKLIHQTMLEKSCFPAVVQRDGFYTYQHRTVPEGYQVSCVEATELFKRVWWGRNSLGHRLGIPVDLLFFNRGTWYPIRGLDLNPQNETIYIKTLGGEVTLHRSDIVVWLKKANENNSPGQAQGVTSGPGSNQYLIS